MVDADMSEVYKRLAQANKPLLDERDREMPLTVNHWGEEPLFQCRRNTVGHPVVAQ